MKLTYEIIRKNYKTFEKSMESFPQIKDYQNNKLDWDLILSLGLCEVTNLCTTFSKIKNVDIALGKVEISFSELKPLLVKYSEELYERGKKIVSSLAKKYNTDWQENDEVGKLRNIKEILSDITKEEFDSYFTSEDKLDTLFPYLWRTERSLNDYMLYEIFNYLVSNEVEVFEEFDRFEYEYMIEEVNFDKMLISERVESIRKTDLLIEEIKNSKGINIEYLMNKLENI